MGYKEVINQWTVGEIKKKADEIRKEIGEDSKMKISVDHPRQQNEKNIDWRDYPAINAETGRKLKYNLGYYFDSWEDYCKSGADTNYDTK